MRPTVTPGCAIITVKEFPNIVLRYQAEGAIDALRAVSDPTQRLLGPRLGRRPAANHAIKFFALEVFPLVPTKLLHVKSVAAPGGVSSEESAFLLQGQFKGRRYNVARVSWYGWSAAAIRKAQFQLILPAVFLKQVPPFGHAFDGEMTEEFWRNFRNHLTYRFKLTCDNLKNEYRNGHLVRTVLSRQLRKMATTPHNWQGPRHVHLMVDTLHFRNSILPHIERANSSLSRDYIAVVRSRENILPYVARHLESLAKRAKVRALEEKSDIQHGRRPRAESVGRLKDRIDSLDEVAHVAGAGAEVTEAREALDKVITIQRERLLHYDLGGVLFTHQ